MGRIRLPLTAWVALVTVSSPLPGQSFPTSDPILRRIWTLAIDSSQAFPLAQTLMDSIGPRLTSSPAHRSANQWLVARYGDWGIPARNERYGTWLGWKRGFTHLDLLQPRVRSLEGTMLAWNPGTSGPVDGPVVALPDLPGASAFAGWLSRLPAPLSAPISLTLPGIPHSGGTDHASFLCYGAPAFRFGEVSWDYFTYTWHTNRDTFDKIVFDDLKSNAALIAMLTYLAAEDPDRMPRDRLVEFPADPRTGAPTTWPTCQPPARTWEERR